MSNHPLDAFLCPLMVECFGPGYQAFTSRAEGNAEVDRYQACDCPDERAQQAATLYLRHLPLVKKILGKFCRQSECHPGVCLPHDLFGDSFPIFRKALDEYDSSYGLDFLGYVSQRLQWGFRKRAAAHLRELDEAVPHDSSGESSGWEDVEDRLLDRVYAGELLSSLGAEEAELVTLRYGCGYSSKELAEARGISPAALRKRFERLRGRLQEIGAAGGQAHTA